MRPVMAGEPKWHPTVIQNSSSIETPAYLKMIQTRIFSNHFDPPLFEDYLCPICHEVLNDPIQTYPCGHNFCSKCYKDWQSKSSLCPNCQKQPESIYPDKRIERDVARQKVICPNKDNQKPLESCTWNGALSDLGVHVGVCDYEVVDCVKCKIVKELRMNLQKHENTTCVEREVKCEYCGIVLKYKNSNGHKCMCPKVPVPCPNRECTKKPAREDIVEHHKICPFESLSCTICFENILRKDMDSHMESALVKHQLSLLQKIHHVQTILNLFTMPVWYITSGKPVSVESSSPCQNRNIIQTNKIYTGITNNKPNWIIVDLNSEVLPVQYKFGYASASPFSRLMRNWSFLGSKDKNEWTLLKKHTNDPTFKFNEAWQIGVWNLEPTLKFRYFRITSDEDMYVYNFDVCFLEKK